MPQQNTPIPPTRAEVTVTALIALGIVASGAACGATAATALSAMANAASLEAAAQGAGLGAGLVGTTAFWTWVGGNEADRRDRCPFYRFHPSAGSSDLSASLLSRDKDDTAPAASPEEM